MTEAPKPRTVFIAGGTGYMGRRLVSALLERQHHVRALVRPGSEHKVPPGCTFVIGDALHAASYEDHVAPADTFVHLVGVAHPSLRKARLFRAIDLASAKAALDAAQHAKIEHFVYVSVAHPAPVMKAYVAARVEVEEAIRESGLEATILRPWYVLGPGHRWPVLLYPFYRLGELFPRTRESARRLGLVTLEQMVHALVHAVEDPSLRILEVPDIRNGRA